MQASSPWSSCDPSTCVRSTSVLWTSCEPQAFSRSTCDRSTCALQACESSYARTTYEPKTFLLPYTHLRPSDRNGTLFDPVLSPRITRTNAHSRSNEAPFRAKVQALRKKFPAQQACACAICGDCSSPIHDTARSFLAVRSLRSRLRSRSEVPPQIPNCSLLFSAYSKHCMRTSHWLQTARADFEDPPRSGKKISGSTSVQRAFVCQSTGCSNFVVIRCMSPDLSLALPSCTGSCCARNVSIPHFGNPPELQFRNSKLVIRRLARGQYQPTATKLWIWRWKREKSLLAPRGRNSAG